MWELCVIQPRKLGTVTPRVSTNTDTPTATKVTAPIPMDVSQMSSNVSKTVEQENDSHQYERDQECDGDELFAVKCKGKNDFQGICFLRAE